MINLKCNTQSCDEEFEDFDEQNSKLKIWF
jgi:hypothetical protein